MPNIYKLFPVIHFLFTLHLNLLVKEVGVFVIRVAGGMMRHLMLLMMRNLVQI